MRILHFIDSLNFGGAEILLMSYIPLLPGDEHFVVTLNGPNVHQKDGYKYICLNLKPVRNIFKIIFVIRKIIAGKQIDVVHSHSFWTNIISRLATPRKIKLINHYHFADYETMKHKPAVKRMLLLDKLMDRKTLVRVAVSEYVEKILKVSFPKGNIKLIPNFINCSQLVTKENSVDKKELKVIAIGNCNLEKNYDLVLGAFEALKEEPISIDIFGGGDRLDFYRSEGQKLGLSKVRFCGFASDVKEKLTNYDLFLSASVSETFGIAVLEAVCAGLPLLISDIPAFNEVAPRSALFFNPYDKNDLIKKMRHCLFNYNRIQNTEYDKVLEKYSVQNFLPQLQKLYNN